MVVRCGKSDHYWCIWESRGRIVYVYDCQELAEKKLGMIHSFMNEIRLKTTVHRVEQTDHQKVVDNIRQQLSHSRLTLVNKRLLVLAMSKLSIDEKDLYQNQGF